jgi:hypothetical protein
VRRNKKAIATLGFGGALMAGAVGVAALPAGAQPVVTGGLVNVTVTDVVSHDIVNVQVPVNVAAQVCGVSANVLSQNTSTSAVNCPSGTLQQVRALT